VIVKTKHPTKAQATKVLNAVRAQCKGSILPGDSGPKLVRDWKFYDWDTTRWSIVWEEGPYQWTYTFPHGGIEEEFGSRLKDVSDRLPAGVWTEACNSFALSVQLDDWT